MTDDNTQRARIAEMLPWHAAGTLSHREAEQVEKALAEDAELARQFDLVREELSETIRLNESLGAPSARAAQTLMAAIDAEQRVGPSRKLGLVARAAAYVSAFSPRALALAASAAAVVIVLQAAVLGGVLVKRGVGTYETASYPEKTAPGAYVLIRFSPQATAADITRFLDGRKAVIVDGPRAGGLYRVRVAPAALPNGQLARIAKEMQEETAVVGFAAATD
jgi:hypothetical protein